MVQISINNIKVLAQRWAANPKLLNWLLPCLLAVYALFGVSGALTGLDPLLPGDDQYFLDFPYRLLAWESVTSGEIPYWNPYNSGGHNLLGQPFHLLVYPLYDLVYLFGKEQLIYVLGAVNVIHLCLASLGMYFLLRKLLKDKLIAFWGGVAYVGAHPVITGFLVGQLLATYVYLPWIFLWMQGFSQRSFRQNVLGMAVLIYLAVAGGFMQWNFFFLLTVFAGLLLRANPLRKKGARSILSGLAIFFVGGALAFSLGAIEFVPEVEQNIHGSRGNLTGETVNRNLQNWTTPYLLSLKIFFPNMFIRYFRTFVPNPTIIESDNFLAYAGIATGLLAIMGLLIGPRKLNSWKFMYVLLFSIALGLPVVTGFLNFLTLGADLVQTRLGGFLAFVGIVLAAGTLSEILRNLGKLKKVLRVMSVFLVLVFAFGYLFRILHLAARSLNNTLGEKAHLAVMKVWDINFTDKILKAMQGHLEIGALYLLLSLCVLFAYYKGWLGRNVMLLTLTLIVLFDTRQLTRQIYEPYLIVKRPIREYFTPTQSEQQLGALLGDEKSSYRVLHATTRLGNLRRYDGGPYMHYMPNANVFMGFYEANAYILNMQKDMGQTLTMSKGGYYIRMGAYPRFANSSLPRMMSIRYLVVPDGEDLKRTITPNLKHKVVERLTDGPARDRKKMKIVELEDVPPRFYFTRRTVSGLSREEIFQRVRKHAFDPRILTYLEGEPAEADFELSAQRVLAIKTPTPNRVVLKVEAESPGVLVANNFWHKWWRVKVNGKEQKLIRANFNFQAVKIPTGRSTIEYYTRANSVILGLVLSMLGLIAFTVLWTWPQLRRVIGSSKSAP